jgi:hypothetical protein
MFVMALRTDGNQQYSWTKNRRSLFVKWTRPRTLALRSDQLLPERTFSASSQLFDLNGEANSVN